MLFEIRRQRIRGVPVPRRNLNDIKPIRGDLRVEEGPAEKLGRRVCRVASVHALDRAIHDEDIPRLYDVILLWMAPLGMVLGGIEIEGDTAYAQTWLCCPVERASQAG